MKKLIGVICVALVLVPFVFAGYLMRQVNPWLMFLGVAIILAHLSVGWGKPRITTIKPSGSVSVMHACTSGIEPLRREA